MKKIAVIGDICKDVFIYGICNRLNPEAPVPIISELYRNEIDGMAGNVHLNVKSLGLNSKLITNDGEITKTRFIEEKSNYILLRFDNDTKISRIKLKNIDIQDYDMIIISDYDKGFLSEEDIEYILNKSKLSFIDTKKPLGKWILPASYVKINQSEFSNSKNDGDVIKILNDNNKLIITLGKFGAKYGEKHFKSIESSNVMDVIGAGDTFLAALSGHYLINNNITKAIEFANVCAGEVVCKRGIGYPETKLI